MPTTDERFSGEAWLEAALVTLLCTDVLNDMSAEDLPELTDDDGTPVQMTAVHAYSDVGMLTLDRGVYLELSDGSAYALTIGVYRRPDPQSTTGRRRRDRHDARRLD